MIILALDQSSQISGYSVFDNKTLITSGTFTASSNDVGKRFEQIRNTVNELIDKYNIEQIKLEDIQLQKKVPGKEYSDYQGNVHTYKILAGVIGVIQELATEKNIKTELITSSTWRSALGIKGSKREVYKAEAQSFVFANYNKRVSEDEADAICIGAYAALAQPVAGFSWGE